MPAKRPPAPRLITGGGKTIEEAADEAWGKAKKGGKKAGWYTIVSIQFYADNPINEYRVQIIGGHS
jgi:hypothetical protein